MAFEFDFREDQVQRILHNNPHYSSWYQALCEVLPKYEITTVPRVAMFMAQCGHESGNFTALKENLNYQPHSLTAIWPKRFPPDVAAQYAHNQEAIANRAYANRMGNGDEASGDGWKFCGRGLIQLTGRTNYTWFAASLGITPEEAEEYLQTFEGAAQSACWFWETNNLNQFADSEDFITMTKRINGGTLGLDDRKAHYERIKRILGA